MASIADLDTKIQELLDAQTAEAARVAAAQTAAQAALDDLSAKLAAAIAAGAPDLSPEIAKVQTAIDSLNATDAAPAPATAAESPAQ